MSKKKKLFNFLNPLKFHKPEATEEDTTPTLKRYFKLLFRKFWKLVSVSLMMLFQLLPLGVIAYLFTGLSTTPTAEHVSFSTLQGLGNLTNTFEIHHLLDIFGGKFDVSVYTTGFWVGTVICAIVLIVTFGWQNAGCTYIFRSLVRGEPVFILSDYFYAVKRNIKPGLILGAIDVVVIALMIFDFIFFETQTGFWNDVGLFFIVALGIIWLTMRMYIYLIMITFDMSPKKILKNALIFSVLGIKRNVLAWIGVLIVTAIAVLMFPLFAMTSLGIALPIILPCIYYMGVTGFTCAYAAYPIIDKYMIAPYRKQESAEDFCENAEKSEE